MTLDAIVPTIANAYLHHWKQPAASVIRVEGGHAVMSYSTFLLLHEYSSSVPSGVYEGKMWRRCDGLFDMAFLANGGTPLWQLVWYDRHPDPDKCLVRTLLIVLNEPILSAAIVPPSLCDCLCEECIMRRSGLYAEQLDL